MKKVFFVLFVLIGLMGLGWFAMSNLEVHSKEVITDKDNPATYFEDGKKVSGIEYLDIDSNDSEWV